MSLTSTTMVCSLGVPLHHRGVNTFVEMVESEQERAYRYAMHRFILKVEVMGLRYREILGDGNSLYRVLAIELARGEESYLQVRQELLM